MAVIAKAEITISKIASVEKITRYYLLQSSTAAVPSKPADGSAISSNWSKTEPSYTSGSTNTLYFVDQTILSDSTIKYSEVSKSSSYEAAKEAWNKANNAQNTADAANKTASNANSTASEAKKTADSANTTAGQAKSAADNASQTASSAKSAADKANENASSAVSTADTAKSTADTARQEASDAAKTATNFMGFDSNGLVIGDRTANTLGKNVLIGNDSINIRNGSTTLAEFAEKLIAIGKGSPNAVIDFLNGLFQISTINDSGARLSATKSLSIYADDAVDGTGDGSGHYSMITVGDTSMRLNTNNVGYIDIVNRNPTIGAIAQIISEVYGQNNENVLFIMETDKSTGRNIVGLDTGKGVSTIWTCNGGGTADITHSVKSTNGSTKVAQWDSSIRFAKNDKLVASYDGTTPVLLSTAVYPNADYTGNFSAPASTQPHGILIEFAPYVDGQAKGYGLVTFFIPKGRCNGESYNIYIDPWCSKWIYVYDNKIVGNDANSKTGTTNGISYNNRKYVLSRVYGV